MDTFMQYVEFLQKHKVDESVWEVNEFLYYIEVMQQTEIASSLWLQKPAW